MNYLSVIERYNEYQDAIHELMASIVTGIFDEKLLEDECALSRAMTWLSKKYPFVELIFTLDANGVQTSQNIAPSFFSNNISSTGQGVERHQRPYYKLAQDSDSVVVTPPYLSTSSQHLCISAALRCTHDNGSTKGFLIIDITLAQAIEFLMGDRQRKKFHPLFISIYSFIVLGLFAVVGILLFSAGSSIYAMLQNPSAPDFHLQPFGIIIYLTLALAIFDLGKTTLEEEVLMHKDIFRHSSTRRTITRFISAILIAVSIESLLLMFKSVLVSPEYLTKAVAMMVAAVGLLVGLGIYVYLGSKAEAILKQSTLKFK
ncbi:PDC sensor domain-containing protein [Candidatus Sororendozoicomonas aggregata]|uniref:PDC sensor domain-containing protein n=1 Tax=Candidatus Sororendozoicomonas aggregata TaxID=3073239 RepID=UPI002ED29978